MSKKEFIKTEKELRKQAPSRKVALSSASNNELQSTDQRAEPTSSTPQKKLLHHQSSNHMGRRRDKLVITDEHLSPQLFAVLQETRMLFSCGHWDHSFKATSLDTGKMIQSVTNHKDLVTCMTIASDVGHTWLITGSRDCTLMVWEVSANRESPIPLQAQHVLYGHNDAVTCVSANADLDIVVSGSDDGTLIIHSLRSGTYIRAILVGSLLASSTDNSDWNSANQTAAVSTTKRRISWTCVTKEGYIVIYIMEECLLCTFTINGRLLVTKDVRERLFAFTPSEDGNVLITGGEFGLVVFRWVRNVILMRIAINFYTFMTLP